MTVRLVTIGGSGDAYLVCALVEAFKRHHGRDDVAVVGKSKYACIANLFRVRYHCDDALCHQAEGDVALQRTYENVLLSDLMPFYVHPCFLRSEIRVDKLTTKPDASQADMYRMILRVPADAPLSIPELPSVMTAPNTVLMIPEAISWPNTQPGFWRKLGPALAATGRTVMENDPKWSLQEVLIRCAAAEWVVGPQCGVMSILVTGRFPCRKTLPSAALTDENKKLSFLSPQTFPYAYVTKFSNEDYDCEEFEVTDDNHDEIVDAIARGQNALRLWPHEPRPVLTISAPLSPGDFLDRLAVLTVKRHRFPVERRAAIEREYRRFADLRKLLPRSPEVVDLFDRMVTVHYETFDVLATMVPDAINKGNLAMGQHLDAVRLNRERVRLKQAVDAACRAPYTEVKSYYGD